MLRSDLCDFSDKYIIVKGMITVRDPNDANYDKKLAFKNNAPFISSILTIYNAVIDNAEDLDIVLPMLYICLNTAKTIEKQQEVCGIIKETNQIAV